MYVRKNVHLRFKKKISKIFQNYSKLCLPGQSLQAAPTEGLTGDSDLRLHHMPEDLELLNHK